MCSTIRPLPLRHCFGWLQGNHVWKAQTSTFHHNLFLPGLLQPVSRSKGPKCARLSAPSLCATVLVGFKEIMYGKPQPVPFTGTFFRQAKRNSMPHKTPCAWYVGCWSVLKTSPSGGVTTFSHVPEGAWSHTRQPSFSPKTSTTCAPVMVALRAL